MAILIEAIGTDRLAEYASIPMVCEIRSILAIDEIDGGLGGLGLREKPVEVPYSKDYDAYSDGGPLRWSERFNLSKWGVWIATEAGKAIGGAAVASKANEIDILGGPDEIAVLWDIRVKASDRRKGVGAALFQHAARWAKVNGCRQMKIETQNVNVGACGFYKKMGCTLGRIDRMAYGRQLQVANEIMLVWYCDLDCGVDRVPAPNGQ